MEYKGIQYRVLQRVGGTGWKWTVQFENESEISGNVLNRKAAQASAERAIENKLARPQNRPTSANPKQDRARTAQSAILKALREERSLTLLEIGRKVNWLAPETIRNHLNLLCTQGLARRMVGIGRQVLYGLPPK